MSVKNSYVISRELSKRVIIDKVLTMSDQDLVKILDTFEESEFRHYIIDEYMTSLPFIFEPTPEIKTIEEFKLK